MRASPSGWTTAPSCTSAASAASGSRSSSVIWADAGNYRVTVSLTDSSNFAAEPIVIEFTIQKYVVDIPSLPRTYEFNSQVRLPDIPTSGSRGSSWSISYDDDQSTTYGVYWATLTLNDTKNYEWNTNFSTGTDGNGDPITDSLRSESVARVFYSITKTTYTATVNSAAAFYLTETRFLRRR